MVLGLASGLDVGVRTVRDGKVALSNIALLHACGSYDASTMRTNYDLKIPKTHLPSQKSPSWLSLKMALSRVFRRQPVQANADIVGQGAIVLWRQAVPVVQTPRAG